MSIKKMFCVFSFSVVVLGLTQGLEVRSDEPGDSAALEKSFIELPAEARRLTGPLYWLHGDESAELLTDYVEVIAAGGNGCFTAESRPHSDWLGPTWYRDLKICLDAAKANDLQMWIFDERWWPSQMVGGLVPPQFGSKYLEATRMEVTSPDPVDVEGIDGPNFVAVVAGRTTDDGKIDAESLVDLSLQIKEGKLRWDAPEGRWSVLHFTWRFAGAKGHQKSWISVDGASRDCVDWFIDYVYQPHYDHFKDDFGKTIPGFFYDEPETQGDWGTEVIPQLKRSGVDWKLALVAWKFELSDPEMQRAAQYQYRHAFAEAWGRTMYGGMSDWCREHGVKSIGHFMEHGRLYLHPTFCAGNMFQLQKYSDMGAIDLVCRQMYPGKRPHDIYQTPKLASSISHVYNKEDDLAMCEIFGGYGQALNYSQMKWLTDQHQVRGVNFMIPHSFNPRSPNDRDYPPYFYNNGHEPRWPLYRVYADYTSRLSLMLTGGRHVCPVAQLFLGQSYHVGKSITPEDMTSALQDALYDCDWMPYDAFTDDTTVDDGELQLHDERYQVLILPAAEVVPYEVLAKARAFFDAGGVVLGYGILPTGSATPGKTSKDIAELSEAIWGSTPSPGTEVCRIGAAGGRSYFLPEIPTAEQIAQVLSDDAGVLPVVEVLEGETDGWLHVLHRVKAESDVFFITNQQHEGAVKQFRLRVRAAGVPECWDAMRGEIRSIPYKRVDDDSVVFSVSLQPLESILLVFRPTARPLPMRLADDAKPAAAPIDVTRIPSAVESPVSSTADPQQAKLAGCPWVWHAADPSNVPPGKRYFRGEVDIPADRSVREASIRMTADNDFAIFVNGADAGRGAGGMEDWRKPRTVNLTEQLKLGRNTLAVVATNFSDEPNPAGLIGAYRIVLDDGKVLSGRIDKSWRSSAEEVAGWTSADFDDSTWTPVREIAQYGGGPWGAFEKSGGRVTKPAVTDADPFVGQFTLPQDWLQAGRRVYLETGEIPHESAAAVTVNGQAAGGFIGQPYRLDITGSVKTGENSVRIEPFAPSEVRVTIYDQ